MDNHAKRGCRQNTDIDMDMLGRQDTDLSTWHSVNRQDTRVSTELTYIDRARTSTGHGYRQDM